MAVNLKETNDGKVLGVQVSGKLTGDDYKQFVPEFERLVSQHGKISILFDMVDFHGWDMKALWEDIKFDAKHFSDIERLAMIGDRKWERWMSDFCRPFTTATIRFFDQDRKEEAKAWIQAEPTASESGRSAVDPMPLP